MVSAAVPTSDCSTDLNWQPNVGAWQTENVDEQLSEWWETGPSQSQTSFPYGLAHTFGGYNGYQCGIDKESSCTSPACGTFQRVKDQPWPYLSVLSTVTLDTLFNLMHDAIGNGEADYVDLVNNGTIQSDFFAGNSPSFPFGDIAIWIVALLGAIAASTATLGAGAVIGGALTFASAGVSQAAYVLQPDSSNTDSSNSGLANGVTTFGSSARSVLENWSTDVFRGGPDATNNTFLDYFKNGSFVDIRTLPSQSTIESFYKKQLVSRTVNYYWRTQKTFIMFMKTNDASDTSGPELTRYYSAEDGGVYYLYYYQEDGVLKGHLDKPFGLDQLNSTNYNITPSDITKSSARAYRHSGFNFTSEDEHNALVGSFHNKTQVPFQDGAGWIGTWTLPVCDIGTNQWNTQYGAEPSRFGMLPCCCGPNCNETKAFVEAAQMNGFQTLLRGCNQQLQNTTIDFNSINYGFEWQKSLPLKWAMWSIGKQVGVGIGLSVLGIFTLGIGLAVALPLLWFL